MHRVNSKVLNLRNKDNEFKICYLTICDLIFENKINNMDKIRNTKFWMEAFVFLLVIDEMINDDSLVLEITLCSVEQLFFFLSLQTGAEAEGGKCPHLVLIFFFNYYIWGHF